LHRRATSGAAGRSNREQVYRLVTKTPQRLNMAVLAALCDILDCGPGDLIEVFTEPAQVANPRSARAERWACAAPS
jgi:hypothetical protein